MEMLNNKCIIDDFSAKSLVKNRLCADTKIIKNMRKMYKIIMLCVDKGQILINNASK